MTLERFEPRSLRSWIARTIAGVAPAVQAVPPPLPPEVPLFVPPGHFYSPITHPAEVARHLDATQGKEAPRQLADVHLDHTAIVETWRALLPYLQSAPFSERPADGLRFGYENPAYSYGDASMLHAMLRHLRPARVVEIGSGWSSAVIVDTDERYLGGETSLTFIEPFPELLTTLVGAGSGHTRVVDRPVQQAPLEIFLELQRNDILLIDSTHVVKTGSDVCFELFEILPRLASGVMVHIHDMFWPFEYPRSWAVNENRSWNELYAIRAFLAGNSQWRVRMFNDYLAQIDRALIEETFPLFLRNPGGALWLERA